MIKDERVSCGSGNIAEMDARSEFRTERKLVMKAWRKSGVDWPSLGAETDESPMSESLVSCRVLTSELQTTRGATVLNTVLLDAAFSSLTPALTLMTHRSLS